MALVAQVIKRPSDAQIISAVKQGYNTSAKLMKFFYGTDKAKSTDPNYKHLNKRILALRKYNFLEVSEVNGLAYTFETVNSN